MSANKIPPGDFLSVRDEKGLSISAVVFDAQKNGIYQIVYVGRISGATAAVNQNCPAFSYFRKRPNVPR